MHGPPSCPAEEASDTPQSRPGLAPLLHTTSLGKGHGLGLCPQRENALKPTERASSAPDGQGSGGQGPVDMRPCTRAGGGGAGCGAGRGAGRGEEGGRTQLLQDLPSDLHADGLHQDPVALVSVQPGACGK